MRLHGAVRSNAAAAACSLILLTAITCLAYSCIGVPRQVKSTMFICFVHDARHIQKSTNIAILQDYFTQTVGTAKKVFLTYGPTGRSRGVATIIFSDPAAGAKAAKQLDGVKVDNRAMKVRDQTNHLWRPRQILTCTDRSRHRCEASTRATSSKEPCRAHVVSHPLWKLNPPS